MKKHSILLVALALMLFFGSCEQDAVVVPKASSPPNASSQNTLARIASEEVFDYTVDPPPGPAGTVPLLHYINRRTNDHFYTTNVSELGEGNSEWSFIRNRPGVSVCGAPFVGYVYTEYQPGLFSVVRLLHIKSSTHFYTTHFDEISALNRELTYEWRFEGIFYISGTQQPGQVAFERYVETNFPNNPHQYIVKGGILAKTFVVSGYNLGSWKFEEIMGYIYPITYRSSN